MLFPIPLLFIIDLSTPSRIITPNDHRNVSFLTIPYLTSNPHPISNVSLLVWDAREQLCLFDTFQDLLTHKPQNLTGPVGLYAKGEFLCFSNQLADVVTGLFDVILINMLGYTPIGSYALDDHSSTRKHTVLMYETDLDLPLSLNLQYSVDITPDANTYKAAAFKSVYISIQSVNWAVSLAKLLYCVKIAFNHLSAKFELTSAVSVLLVETIFSLTQCVLMVDYFGKLGVYSLWTYSVLINVCITLEFLSTFILTEAFQSVFLAVSGNSNFLSHGKKLVSRGLIMFSVLTTAALAVLRYDKTYRASDVLDMLNGFTSLSYHVFIAGLYLGAKKQVLGVLLETKENVVTTEKKKVEKMYRYMVWSAVFLIANLVIIAVTVVFVVLRNHPVSVFLVGLGNVVLSLIGFCHVLAFPKTRNQ